MSNNVFLPSYSIGDNVYSEIYAICKSYGKKAIVIGGETAIEKSKNLLLDGLKNSNIEILDFLWFGSDATYENVERLKNNKKVNEADMIFAVGGGRSIDTNKVLSDKLNKPLFTFPTIASNCAPITKISVMYNENHTFKDYYFPKRSPLHCFINTKIISEAPTNFIWAGIGDALSKEFECTFSSKGDVLTHSNLLGVSIAKNCCEPLLKYGQKAFNDAKENRVSKELEEVILNIIITTGLVSVLVDPDYNSCLAHSIYYGYTTIHEIEKNHLHGEVVSYGVLVMLTCIKDYKNRDKIYKFNKSIDLPTCLKDIEVKDCDIPKILDKAIKTEDIKHVPYELTKDMIYNAILDLEKLSS